MIIIMMNNQGLWLSASKLIYWKIAFLYYLYLHNWFF